MTISLFLKRENYSLLLVHIPREHYSVTIESSLKYFLVFFDLNRESESKALGRFGICI